jgi:hypothetical protein
VYEVYMPGDPKRCRDQAATCRKLAAEAHGPAVRDTFIHLAGTWERLADEFESTRSLFQAIESLRPPTPIE